MNLSPFEDKQMLSQYLEENCFENIPHLVRHGSSKLQCKCVLCGDGGKASSKRLWVDLHEAFVFCWNAGCIAADKGLQALRFTAVLHGVGYSQECATYVKWVHKHGGSSRVASSFTEDVSEMAPKSEPVSGCAVQTEEIEDSWVELPPSVRQYCEQRHLFDAPFLPKEWHLYLDSKSKRLVIPWYRDSQIEYWQKRALLSGDDPKYLYKPNTSRPVFNLDSIDDSWPFIMLVEGAIDSIFTANGIGLGGIKPSAEQLQLIKSRFPNHELVYLLDNQWVDKSAKIALMGSRDTVGLINTHVHDRKFFIWPKCPYKDINDCVIANDQNFRFHDRAWLQSHIFSALQSKILLSSRQ